MADLEGLTRSPVSERDLEDARSLLAAARRVLFLTGAGVSAESGVPTFRGPDGLWNHHRPETLATPEAFQRDPRLVWEWYAWRQERVSACAPNPAHHAMAAWVHDNEGARVVTQNVDGLHERAAREAAEGGRLAARELPLELHGSLFRVKCTRCDRRRALEAQVDASSQGSLPLCADCGALLRPAVVWFGEALDESVLQEAFQLAGRADLCLVIGTSALVHPAASLPLVTLRAGGKLVEVNPEPTPLTPDCHVSLRAPAGVILPALVRAP